MHNLRLKINDLKRVSLPKLRKAQVNNIFFELFTNDLRNPATGRKIVDFFLGLKKRDIAAAAINAIPRCVFSGEDIARAKELGLIRSCFECPMLFRVSRFNRVIFCSGKQGGLFDDYPSKESVFRDFVEENKKNKAPRICRDCSEKAYCSYGCINRKHNFHSSAYADNYKKVDLLGGKENGLSGYYAGSLKEVNKFPFRPMRIFCFSSFICNNDCRYCFHEDKRKLKDPHLNFLKKMITEASSDFPMITFAGGEPTLDPHLLGLIRLSKQKGLIVHVFTNGRRLEDAQFAKDMVNSGVDIITEVFHSHNPKIHDYITRRKGSFRQMVRGIANLHSLGFYNLHAMLVIHKQNYRDLKRLAEFLISLKFQVSFESLELEGNALDNFKELAVRLSELVPFIEEAFDFFIEKGFNFAVHCFPLCLFKEKYWRYFSNTRYWLLATNYAFKKNTGKRVVMTPRVNLGVKCIDCTLKKYCPGTWESYYRYFGEEELCPSQIDYRPGENIKKLKGRFTFDIAGELIKIDFDSSVPGILENFIQGVNKPMDSSWQLVSRRTGRLPLKNYAGRDTRLFTEREPRQDSAPVNASIAGAASFFRNNVLRIDPGRRKLTHLYLKGQTAGASPLLINYAYSQILPLENGLLLHAASVSKDGRGFLFLGPSEGGKSTVASLSRRHTVIGDDIVAVKKRAGGFLAYATPWKQRDFIKADSRVRAALKAMIFLKKSDKFSLEPLREDEALLGLMNQIPFLAFTERPFIDKLFSTCVELARTMPCYRMGFRREEDFWPVLERELDRYRR
ncbi:radical SAM protein [Candidatus Omnitrophota bacterium]